MISKQNETSCYHILNIIYSLGFVVGWGQQSEINHLSIILNIYHVTVFIWDLTQSSLGYIGDNIKFVLHHLRGNVVQNYSFIMPLFSRRLTM